MSTIATEAVNLVPTRTGKVRLVCEFCGRLSGPRDSGMLSALPLTWSIAPFPADYVHRDGSRGSLYSCPEHRGAKAIGHRSREYLDGSLPTA